MTKVTRALSQFLVTEDFRIVANDLDDLPEGSIDNFNTTFILNFLTEETIFFSFLRTFVISQIINRNIMGNKFLAIKNIIL